jgi:hypothetical protein
VASAKVESGRYTQTVLPGLQFTDFHKFLVSVGGLFLASGFALPLVLLRPQNALLVPEKEISLLVPAAETAVRSQQDQLALLIRNWPFASAVLVVLGTLLVTKGAIMWKRRQDRLNERDDAEIDRVKAEREKFHQETLALARQHQESLSQADASLEEKAAESVGEKNLGDEKSRLEVTTAGDKTPEGSLQASASEQHDDEKMTISKKQLRALTLQVEAEELVVKKVRSFYRGHLDVVRDVRIGNLRADSLIISRSPDMPNLILDIRTVFIHPDWVANLRHRLQSSLRWMSQVKEGAAELHTDIKPVALFVFDKNPSEKQVLLVRRMISRLLDEHLTAKQGSLDGLIALMTITYLQKPDSLVADLTTRGSFVVDFLDPQ